MPSLDPRLDRDPPVTDGLERRAATGRPATTPCCRDTSSAAAERVGLHGGESGDVAGRRRGPRRARRAPRRRTEGGRRSSVMLLGMGTNAVSTVPSALSVMSRWPRQCSSSRAGKSSRQCAPRVSSRTAAAPHQRRGHRGRFVVSQVSVPASPPSRARQLADLLRRRAPSPSASRSTPTSRDMIACSSGRPVVVEQGPASGGGASSAGGVGRAAEPRRRRRRRSGGRTRDPRAASSTRGGSHRARRCTPSRRTRTARARSTRRAGRCAPRRSRSGRRARPGSGRAPGRHRATAASRGSSGTGRAISPRRTAGRPARRARHRSRASDAGSPWRRRRAGRDRRARARPA